MYHEMMSNWEALRIEEVAAATGLSTRNVRAYQSLGLLPVPLLDGRVGRYGAAHLERLRAVGRLRAAGFSLAAIKALFDAHDRGEDLGSVLGLSDAARPARARRASPLLRLALVPQPLSSGLAGTGS